MWLINTETFKLEHIINHETVSYAILSHTWEDEEVSFQELRDLDSAKKKRGFDKISATCRLARTYSLDYAWVDTCCIDKTSSAELSEAINSMFRYYKDSFVCFVYLSDLVTHDDIGIIESVPGVVSALEKCRWFNRGWTLQELIAPTNMIFYDHSWTSYGSKDTLGPIISKITTIGLDILSNSELIDSVPVAQRMSWAAARETTRPEDLAYCLLGIFDINMPLLYGEGKKAFLRLQEEICRRSRDLTLFAWEASPSATAESKYHGLFAQNPRDFSNSWCLTRDATRTPYTGELRLTNKGVCLEGVELIISSRRGIFMSLGCCGVRRPGTAHIRLTKTMDGYVRTDPDQLFTSAYFEPFEWRLPENVYIPTALSFDHLRRLDAQSIHLIKIKTPPSEGVTLRLDRIVPSEYWDPHQSAFLIACTTAGHGEYQGLIELVARASNGSTSRLILMFELRAHYGQLRTTTMRHVVVDEQREEWAGLLEWLKNQTMGRNLRERLREKVLAVGAHVGVGNFVSEHSILGTRLTVSVDAQQLCGQMGTMGKKGQVWEVTLKAKEREETAQAVAKSPIDSTEWEMLGS